MTNRRQVYMLLVGARLIAPLLVLASLGSGRGIAIGMALEASPAQRTNQPCLPAWRLVPGPEERESSVPLGIAAVGPNDIWAVGRSQYWNEGMLKPLILHWNGARWDEAGISKLGPGAALAGVAVIRQDDAWAVGYSGEPRVVQTRPFTAHWDGHTW